MREMTMAFVIWALTGGVMTALGIVAFCSKKARPFGFWANAKMFEVSDVRAYNRALGKLWCVFGAVFMLLGTPLLGEQNSPYIILSILGCMVEVIVAMVVYVTVIEKKYRTR